MKELTNTDKMREIRDEILALKESPLYEYRVKNKYFPVIGEGAHDARIMFVGEAPGENEAKTGRPFCGASGRILDELLASIGMDRKKVYVTNVVKDRPQDNRDPSPHEINLYGPFLDRQIDIMRPSVVATLGRHSMSYLFNRYNLGLELQSISKIHGQTFTAEAPWGTFTLIALYHPAVALYNGSMKKTLLEDFKIMKQHV